MSTTKPKPKRPPARRPAAKPGLALPTDDLQEEVKSIVANSDVWLNTPNDLFGGRAPVELIGTPDEHFLREWVGAVKHGIMS